MMKKMMNKYFLLLTCSFINIHAMDHPQPIFTAEELAKLAESAKPLKQWRNDQIEHRSTPRYTLINPQGQNVKVSPCPIDNKDLPKEAVDKDGQLKSDWRIDFCNIEEIFFTEDN
ncbi:hypothetical protein BH09DEP1_BH09DEP1_1770 [soil metagenome]